MKVEIRQRTEGSALGGRYGDYLRSGWRDILDCTVRLHKLGLLPAAVLRADGESADAAAQRMPKPSMPPRTGSSGVLYRAFTRCLRRSPPRMCRIYSFQAQVPVSIWII